MSKILHDTLLTNKLDWMVRSRYSGSMMQRVLSCKTSCLTAFFPMSKEIKTKPVTIWWGGLSYYERRGSRCEISTEPEIIEHFHIAGASHLIFPSPSNWMHSIVPVKHYPYPRIWPELHHRELEKPTSSISLCHLSHVAWKWANQVLDEDITRPTAIGILDSNDHSREGGVSKLAWFPCQREIDLGKRSFQGPSQGTLGWWWHSCSAFGCLQMSLGTSRGQICQDFHNIDYRGE